MVFLLIFSSSAGATPKTNKVAEGRKVFDGGTLHLQIYATSHPASTAGWVPNT